MQLNLANQTVLLFVRRLSLNMPVFLRFGAKLNLASTGIDLQIVFDELDCKDDCVTLRKIVNAVLECGIE